MAEHHAGVGGGVVAQEMVVDGAQEAAGALANEHPPALDGGAQAEPAVVGDVGEAGDAGNGALRVCTRLKVTFRGRSFHPYALRLCTTRTRTQAPIQLPRQ